MISNSYGAVKGAGLFRTLTPKSETTDMLATRDSGFYCREKVDAQQE